MTHQIERRALLLGASSLGVTSVFANIPMHIYEDSVFDAGSDFERYTQAAPNGDSVYPVSRTYSVALWGAKGNGIVDDTAAIQHAVDFVVSQGGGVIWFPSGTYLITSIDVQEGLILQGDGGVVITRPPKQAKFSRLFTTQNRRWKASVDSPPLIFRNLHFHGNRTRQGIYTGHELEQQHMIFAMGDADNMGRLRLIVERCTFEQGTGDGISIYNNVDATITNCLFHEIFRGGIVLTGGWSRLRAANCVMTGNVHPTGLDIEIDGQGYNGSIVIDVKMINIDMSGDFDISIPVGGRAFLVNINSRGAPFSVTGPGTIHIENSQFVIGEISSTKNRIVWPTDTQFSNCKFIIEGPGKASGAAFACAHIYWNITSTDYKSQRIIFDGCSFGRGSNISDGDDTYGVFVEPDDRSLNNLLIIQNCEFNVGLKHGVWLKQGGTVELIDNFYDCVTAMRFAYAVGFHFDVLVEGGDLGQNCAIFADIHNSHMRNNLSFRRVTLMEEQNVLVSAIGLADNSYHGFRTIFADGSPSDDMGAGGLSGDIWQRYTPRTGHTSQWICTKPHHQRATWIAFEDITDRP